MRSAKVKEKKMTEAARTEEQYPKHRDSFEEAVRTAIECARLAGENRGYFDAMDLDAGKGMGYVYRTTTRSGHETYTILTGLGSEIPSDAEARIRRLDRMSPEDTLAYLGAVDTGSYSGRDPEGERVAYRLVDSRELRKVEGPGVDDDGIPY